MHFLSEKLEFPPVNQTNEYGMLAIGGDLSKERLQLAYKNGVFPWFSDGEPIVWYCPQDRMVLFPEEFIVSKSMRQVIRKNEFIVTENQAFREVIYNCKNINRKEEFGTWITDEMQEAYIQLHEIGVAKSVEVWQKSGVDTQSPRAESRGLNEPMQTNSFKLVGGLYGVEVGNVFCGESMFSKVSNASKVAVHYLINERSETNPKQSKYQLIDCQIYNDHLASLGAREISRNEFLKILKGKGP